MASDVTCPGGEDGEIALFVTGSCSPYSYLWNTGDTTQNLTGIPAGMYEVTVTDAGGNMESASITVTEPDSLMVTLVGTDVTCYNGDDGMVSAEITGGCGPYFYDWCTGLTGSQKLCNVVAGTYSVTITDASGNQVTDSVTISEPDRLAVYFTKTDISCQGAQDGSIDLSVSGSCPPYEYEWSTGDTTQDLANLMAGFYEVMIYDAGGNFVEKEIEIKEAEPLTLQLVGWDPECAGDSNGKIISKVSGSCPPYSYKWNNGVTTEDLCDIPAGTYELTVKDSAGNCVTESLTIGVEPLSISAGENQTVYYGYEPKSCAVLTASIPTGGTPPYSIEWSTGEMTESITVCPESSQVYSLTVTDSYGCTFTDDVEVCVVDVHCGHYSNKVEICNKQYWQTYHKYSMCVAPQDVPYYLQNGYKLGACGSYKCNEPSGKDENSNPAAILKPFVSTSGMRLSAAPNPFNRHTMLSFSLPVKQRVVLKVYNSQAQEVSVLFEGEAEAGKEYQLELSPESNWQGGIYFYHLISENGVVKQGKLLFQR